MLYKFVSSEFIRLSNGKYIASCNFGEMPKMSYCLKLVSWKDDRIIDKEFMFHCLIDNEIHSKKVYLGIKNYNVIDIVKELQEQLPHLSIEHIDYQLIFSYKFPFQFIFSGPIMPQMLGFSMDTRMTDMGLLIKTVPILENIPIRVTISIIGTEIYSATYLITDELDKLEPIIIKGYQLDKIMISTNIETNWEFELSLQENVKFNEIYATLMLYNVTVLKKLARIKGIRGIPLMRKHEVVYALTPLITDLPPEYLRSFEKYFWHYWVTETDGLLHKMVPDARPGDIRIIELQHSLNTFSKRYIEEKNKNDPILISIMD